MSADEIDVNIEESENPPEKPQVRVVLGPPRQPGDIPLEPPIALMVSRADRAWMERMRRRA